MRKRGCLTLGSIGDAISSRGTQIRAQAILILANLLDEAAHMQGVQESKTHALVETCPGNEVPQPKHLAFRFEGAQNLGSMNQRLDYIVAMIVFISHEAF